MNIITTEQAAKILNTSPRRVRQLIKELGLETVKIGNTLILSRMHVAAMGRRNKQRGPLKGNGGKKK